MTDLDALQLEVSRLLSRGVVFSIVWLMGFGSLYAIVCAAKARRLIKASDGELYGMARVWWCFIVGGIGMVVWAPVVFALVKDVAGL